MFSRARSYTLVIYLAFVLLPHVATWGTSSFTPMTFVNTNAATDSQYDYQPSIATNGNGRWITVWYSSEPTIDNSGPDFDVILDFSDDDGATWSPPSVIHPFATQDSYGDFYPQIATDRRGTWLVVWSSEDPLNNTIGTDQDVLFSRSTDDGHTWTAPLPVHSSAVTDSGLDMRPKLATDNNGTWIVVWHSNDSLNGTCGTDYDIFVARSTDNGLSWSSAVPIHANAFTDSGMDSEATIATDSQGTWVALWSSNDSLNSQVGSDRDIFWVRSADNGISWSTPTPLNRNAYNDLGGDYWPEIATDGQGNWVAIWRSTENLGGTIGTDGDILTAYSRDNAVTWSDPIVLNGNAATDGVYDDNHPIVKFGYGRVLYAFWESDDSFSGMFRPYGNIFYARSMDFGKTWTFPKVVNSNASTDEALDRFPTVASNGQGKWLVAWQTNANFGGIYGIDLDIACAEMQDSDMDGLPDSVETATGTFVDDEDTGTSPTTPDTDQDGMPDAWEVDLGLDPNDDGSMNSVNGPLGDPDGDGIVNIDEYRSATNPWIRDVPILSLFSAPIIFTFLCILLFQIRLLLKPKAKGSLLVAE